MSVTQAPRRRLFDVVEQTLGAAPGSVSRESSPETLPRWDSLNHLNLVMAIESEFEVSFSPEDVLDMRTVELIETVLRDYGVQLS